MPSKNKCVSVTVSQFILWLVRKEAAIGYESGVRIAYTDLSQLRG